MTHDIYNCIYNCISDTVNKLFERLPEFKSKILYLSNIFTTVNLFSLDLQGRRSDIVT